MIDAFFGWLAEFMPAVIGWGMVLFLTVGLAGAILDGLRRGLKG